MGAFHEKYCLVLSHPLKTESQCKTGFNKFKARIFPVFPIKKILLSLTCRLRVTLKLNLIWNFQILLEKKLREIMLQSKVYFKLPSGLIHPWTTRQSTLSQWDTSKTVENLHFYLKYNVTSNNSKSPQPQEPRQKKYNFQKLRAPDSNSNSIWCGSNGHLLKINEFSSHNRFWAITRTWVILTPLHSLTPKHNLTPLHKLTP